MRMKKSLNNVLVNSTLAFVLAFFVTTFVHEFGHFFAYTVFGANPVMFHNAVQTGVLNLNVAERLVAVLAGPCISLLQGLLFGFLISRRRGDRIIDLLFLWLGLLGFINFCGYLLLTPLSSAGDTGKAADLLHSPMFVRIVVALFGLTLMFYVVFNLGKFFSNFIPATSDARERSKYVYHLLFYPILIGSFVNTLFSLPAPVAISIIYPATSSFVIMSAFGAVLNSPGKSPASAAAGEKISLFLAATTLLAIVINRLLTLGLG